MRTPFRITAATLDVLEAFLASRDELHGFAVAKAAAKPTGSIYPILGRLEQAGWLTSHWETENPSEGRPRRRFYTLTPDGTEQARAVVIERRGKLPSPYLPPEHQAPAGIRVPDSMGWCLMSLTEILIGLVLGAVVNEACDVSPWLARRLLRWSAHRISDADMAERYEEEWLSLLDERPGKLLKLTFAVWITIRSTRTLRSLHQPTRAAAPARHEETRSTSQYRRRPGTYVRGHYRRVPPTVGCLRPGS
ncbi:hypothetical protein GCM10020254_82330 [Streptomyces goshikiensis]